MTKSPLETLAFLGEYYLADKDSQLRKDIPEEIISGLLHSYNLESALENPETILK